MKTCCCCKADKPLSEFWPKQGKCIACKKESDIGRRRYREDRTGLNSTPAARARKRRWMAANRDPLKDAARRAVRNAIVSGVLTRPTECGECGLTAKRIDGINAIQAHHHNGYDHPLEVEWLCPKCHRIHDDAARAAQKEG